LIGYFFAPFQIERHLALGGSDSPGEVLVMFLFRYGNAAGFNNIHHAARTPLSQLKVIESKDGGVADMGNSFQIGNCVTVFEACWQRLRTKLKQQANPEHSILRFIVDAKDLQNKRRSYSQKASHITRYEPPQHLNQRSNSGLPSVASRNNAKLLQQQSSSEPRQSRNLNQGNSSGLATRNHSKLLRQQQPMFEPRQLDTDEEAEQIIAGYGQSSKPKESKQNKKRPKKTGKKTKKEEKRQKLRKVDKLVKER
jgi:hypothetical protein